MDYIYEYYSAVPEMRGPADSCRLVLGVELGNQAGESKLY
jgi:hypothetical protein